MFNIVLLENLRFPSETKRLKKIFEEDNEFGFSVKVCNLTENALPFLKENDVDCVIINDTIQVDDINRIKNYEEEQDLRPSLKILLQYGAGDPFLEKYFDTDCRYNFRTDLDKNFKEWLLELIGRKQLIKNNPETPSQNDPWGKESTGINLSLRRTKKKNLWLSTILSLLILCLSFTYFYYRELNLQSEDIQKNSYLKKTQIEIIEKKVHQKIRTLNHLNQYLKLSKELNNKLFHKISSSLLLNNEGIYSIEYWNHPKEMSPCDNGNESEF